MIDIVLLFVKYMNEWKQAAEISPYSNSKPLQNKQYDHILGIFYYNI